MSAKSNVNITPTKRTRDSENDSDENEELDAGAFAQMTRSQRKCHRERRRRSEVNKGFDDLTSLLWEIDGTTMRTEIENHAQRGKKQATMPTEDIVLSRVDLINFTISLVRRLHTENERRKEIISTLSRAGTHDSTDLNLSVASVEDINVPNIGNVTVPNIGNVATLHDTDRARLSAAEAHQVIAPSTTSFPIGSLSLPSAPLDAQQLFHQRLLLDQLTRAQAANTGVDARSIHDVLNQYSMQNLQAQNDMGGYRNDSTSLPIAEIRNPHDHSSSIGGGNSIKATSLLGSSNNSDAIAMFLARQQRNIDISQLFNNNASNMRMPDTSTTTVDHLLGGGATDTTRQLLQLMQNRQTNLNGNINLAQLQLLRNRQINSNNDVNLAQLQLLQNRQINSNNDVNLAQVEALLQQQLQQKPPGR